jgi:hypothetical protein
MDIQESRRQSLRDDADRTCLWVGIVLAISWLFSAFSYYLFRTTGFDWFSRSGAVMVLIGAAATFRLSGMLQRTLATALKEELGPLHRGVELILEPPRTYQTTTYFGYVTGIIGTLIWGYGDVLSKWASHLLG